MFLTRKSSDSCNKNPKAMTKAANISKPPMAVRIRARVCAHAELIGKKRPAPLILIDALPRKQA